MASAYTAGYFAGKSGESPELFIENVNAYCALRNDMAPQKFFPLALPDGAKAWYLNLDEGDKKNWDKLQNKFKERYDPPDILNFAQAGDVFLPPNKKTMRWLGTIFPKFSASAIQPSWMNPWL